MPRLTPTLARIVPLVPLVLVVTALASASPASAQALADPRDELAAAGFFAADELDARDAREELAFFDPLDLGRGSFGFSLSGGVARWNTPLGTAMRWETGVLVHLPLDRLLSAGRSPVFSATSSPSPIGDATPMDRKRPPRLQRLGTLALPSAIALGGAFASAKEPTTSAKLGKPATSSSASISATGVAANAGSGSISGFSGASPLAAASSAPPPVALQATSTLPAGALRSLVDAALREAGLTTDDDLLALASRAKSSALAPEVRLRAHRTLAVGARIFSSDALADHTTLSDGAETFVEARLTWRLDRLVFADEEIAVERVKLERAELRQRIIGRVVELAIAYVRARRAAANVDLLPEEREEAALRSVEALLALDALTGGLAGQTLP